MPSAIRCPSYNCGGMVEPRIVQFGRVVYVCDHCTRKKARLCRDCPDRTPSPWHWRCLPCGAANRRNRARPRDRARYPKRRREIVARWKRRMADEAFRAARRDYMAAYRKRHPRDEQDRAYGRSYMQARRADPAYRARELRRKRAARRQMRKAA